MAIIKQSDDTELDYAERRAYRTFLRSLFAIDEARRLARYLARMADCRLTKLLDQEVFDILDNADTAGIPQDVLDSFEKAAIVIEATHRDSGETHYIVVEASYMAIRRDAERAIRNAELLTRFTGKPAHAMVAAPLLSRDIEPLVESGEVHWARILEKQLEKELDKD